MIARSGDDTSANFNESRYITGKLARQIRQKLLTGGIIILLMTGQNALAWRLQIYC
jgi:hypothetical protein